MPYKSWDNVKKRDHVLRGIAALLCGENRIHRVRQIYQPYIFLGCAAQLHHTRSSTKADAVPVGLPQPSEYLMAWAANHGKDDQKGRRIHVPDDHAPFLTPLLK